MSASSVILHGTSCTTLYGVMPTGKTEGASGRFQRRFQNGGMPLLEHPKGVTVTRKLMNRKNEPEE